MQKKDRERAIFFVNGTQGADKSPVRSPPGQLTGHGFLVSGKLDFVRGRRQLLST